MTPEELHAVVHAKSVEERHARLVLFCRGATARAMCTGGMEAIVRPRLAPGTGVSYAQVEIRPDPGMGAGAWRLLNLDAGEVLAEGTVDPS